MRREELQKAVERIINDLDASGLQAMLEKGVEHFRPGRTTEDRKSSDWISLVVLASYFTRTSNYGEIERKIQEIMEIKHLSEPEIWASNFSTESPEFLYENRFKIRQVRDFLPKVIKLLRREYETDVGSPEDPESEVIIQRIVLTDEGASLSSATRIVEMIQSIEQLYSTICHVHGSKESKIAIVGIDSGSEKSFDFLGVAQFMKELRETLKEVYNMVAFHKQNVTMKNLQVAGESIGIVAEIGKLEQAGGLTSDEASRMRHSLFSALERFASTGAYTPEMGEQVQPPALTMRPQPRLLTGPASDLVREANSSNDASASETSQINASGDPVLPEDEFSQAEIAAALNLLRKAKSTKAKNGSKQRSTRSIVRKGT